VCSMSKDGAGDVETLLDGGGGTGDDDRSHLVLTVAWFPSIEPPNLAPSKWLWTWISFLEAELMRAHLARRSKAIASGGLCM
jgi:hypothetical protein